MSVVITRMSLRPSSPSTFPSIFFSPMTVASVGMNPISLKCPSTISGVQLSGLMPTMTTELESLYWVSCPNGMVFWLDIIDSPGLCVGRNNLWQVWCLVLI